jgi:histone acetyltransferase MYST2
LSHPRVPNHKNSKSSLSSTDGDESNVNEVASKSSSKKHTQSSQHGAEQKKNAIQKPNASAPVPSGGKVPPSVMKQHQAMQHQSKGLVPSKMIATSSAGQNKELKSFANKNSQKNKSIFSPINSSESDDDDNNSDNSDDDDDEDVNMTKKEKSNLSIPSSTSTKGSARGRGRPRKYPQSSSTSASTSKTAKTRVRQSDKDKGMSKEKSNDASNVSSEDASGGSNSDSDSESATNNNNSKSNANSRKSTRTNSTKKYNMNNKMQIGDSTESESEDNNIKPTSKNSTKKITAFLSSKDKLKQQKKKNEQKHNAANAAKALQTEKKGCPLESCNSNGHLSGKYEKHFTLEACPEYHNATNEETKIFLAERKKRCDERAKVLKDYDPKRPQGNEQRAYLQKLREMRAKFKPTVKASDISCKEDREPLLNGIVSDYDYQLFRDAQAIASENIENELKQLPYAGNIKHVVMGKHNMEVWYSSPYPENVQRLPKLYLCEFCLRYQKSEIGMKRHVMKCIWKTPPGDEIYRKGKLCVWQVDGKRHKVYCQYLCLLAKFFLDHKTLYFDVDPFLFYIMTIADSDGCHIVGYFSKVSA